MSTFTRGTALRQAPFTQAAQAKPVSRVALRVEANKKVIKKQKIILTKEIASLGSEGQIVQVPVGYWRNYLLPNNYAKIATQDILEVIRKQKEDELRVKLEEKAQAQAFANALSTIGKFMIKKKVGEKDQIFGSVSVAEIAESIYQQTGKKLPEGDFTVPEIKVMGTYECSVVLHPEVTGNFSVVIQREKNVQGAKKK